MRAAQAAVKFCDTVEYETRRVLIEIFCEKDSTLASAAQEDDWDEVIRITKEDDFELEETQSRIKQACGRTKHPALHISMPCTPWCRLSELNMSKSENTKMLIIAARAKSYMMLVTLRNFLRQVKEICEPVISKEWPAGIGAWDLDVIKDIEKDHGLKHQTFEGCKVGLRVTSGPEEGLAMRKPWQIASNCAQLNAALAKRRCLGDERCDEHARIEGAKTKPSGSYPQEMSQLMVQAYNAWYEESALKKAAAGQQAEKKSKDQSCEF